MTLRSKIVSLRNFNWRSETDFDPIWEQRTYYLSRVTDVDLIMSYWMGETIAHTIVSFGFVRWLQTCVLDRIAQGKP